MRRTACLAATVLSVLVRCAPALADTQVTGVARLLEKVVPPRGALEMSAECVAKNGGQPAYDQSLVVNEDGTLRNVFVYVSAGLEDRVFAPPAEPAVVDERGCLYHPHVLGMVAGQSLKLINTDRMLDNLHTYPKVNEPINVTVLAFQPEVVVTTGFSEPEIMIPLKCDVHRWQLAYIGVLHHPFFAVTGDGGTFALDALPPGDYSITAWHERLGTHTQAVTLGEGPAATLDFTFSLADATAE